MPQLLFVVDATTSHKIKLLEASHDTAARPSATRPASTAGSTSHRGRQRETDSGQVRSYLILELKVLPQNSNIVKVETARCRQNQGPKREIDH